MSEIGDRIREAAKSCGTVERMAELAGIPRRTLYNYLKGPREPKAAQLAAISKVTNVRLEWLITGQEPKEATAAPNLPVEPWAMGRAYSVIEKVCKDIGRPVTGSQLAEEAAELYSALLARVVDVRDKPMVEAALSVLGGEAKERMISAKPGIDKRSASSS